MTSSFYPALVLSTLVAAGCGSDETSPTSTSTSGATTVSSSNGSGGGAAGGGGQSVGGGGAGASGGGAAGGGTGGVGGMVPQDCLPDGNGMPPPLKLTEVAGGLDSTVFAGGAPGDTTRLYILDQHLGQVRLVKDSVLLPAPFLTVPGVGQGNEQGLLGLAFHPGYAVNGRFFLYYTVAGPENVVAEYARSAADPDTADPAPVKVILSVPQAPDVHNGGMLAFGPDGKLYVSKGDGGTNSQDVQSKLGKILRIDVDTHPVPPPGNLPGADPDVWDYGLRNPWRFSFDRCNGDMYIGDVGASSWEEINVEPAGQGNKNYGWTTMEGTDCYNPAVGCDMTGITLPVVQYDHGEGCSVTGGYVYRGTKIPSLVGSYLYSDYCTGFVRTLVWKNGQLMGESDLTAELGGLSVTAFGQDTAGELYIVDRNGEVYLIEPQ